LIRNLHKPKGQDSREKEKEMSEELRSKKRRRGEWKRGPITEAMSGGESIPLLKPDLLAQLRMWIRRKREHGEGKEGLFPGNDGPNEIHVIYQKSSTAAQIKIQESHGGDISSQ